MKTGTPALEATRRWLERAVIGLNLCPFAKAVHAKGLIRWVESPAATPAALLEQLVDELRALADADADLVDTTLIVAPHALPRFDDFNRFLGLADHALAHLGLQGTLQVAAFHPQWVFDGTAADDIANHSNRAPHPTLHLLREASVARAVAAYPDAEAIYGRNIATLRRLGPAGWRALFER
ncbi:MAG: DUF1415 domain-containing protein [Rubrivivax sp.]